MTSRHYRIFTEVCRQKSMTRAAERLNMTQPSISQAVAELESHYNLRLFERFGKKLFITDDGRKLLGYTGSILDIIRKMDEDMHAAGSSGGTLKVGATVTIGTCLLSGFVQKFKADMPGAQITSVVDNTAVIEEMLLNNELDIALIEGLIRSEHLKSRPFTRDVMTLAAGAEHPLNADLKYRLSDLKDRLFIVRERGSGTRATFENLMNERGIRWKEAWVCNNPEAIKRAVERGLGLTVISELAIISELKSGSLKKIVVEDAAFGREFRFVYHKDKFITPAIRKFQEVVESCTEH